MKIEAGNVFKTKGHGVLVKVLYILTEEDVRFSSNRADDRFVDLRVVGLTEHGQTFMWQLDGTTPVAFGIDSGMDLVPLDWQPEKEVS